MINEQEQLYEIGDAINLRLIAVEKDLNQLKESVFDHMENNALILGTNSGRRLFNDHRHTIVDVDIHYLTFNLKKYSKDFPYLFSSRRFREDVFGEMDMTGVMQLFKETIMPKSAPPCLLYYNLLHESKFPKHKLPEIKSLTIKMSFDDTFGFTISENGNCRVLKF